MDGWVVWLLVACGFGISELLSGSAFYLAPFGIGAAVAALADLALGDLVAVIVFLAASIATLMLVRPLVTSRLMSGPQLRTGAQALIGRSATVIESIPASPSVASGTIKIGGEIWSAQSLDHDHDIPAGTEVQVVEIKGATALVIE